MYILKHQKGWGRGNHCDLRLSDFPPPLPSWQVIIATLLPVGLSSRSWHNLPRMHSFLHQLTLWTEVWHSFTTANCCNQEKSDWTYLGLAWCYTVCSMGMASRQGPRGGRGAPSQLVFWWHPNGGPSLLLDHLLDFHIDIFRCVTLHYSWNHDIVHIMLCNLWILTPSLPHYSVVSTEEFSQNKIWCFPLSLH